MRKYWCTSPGQLITRSADEACKPGEDPSGFDNGTKLENQETSTTHGIAVTMSWKINACPL